MNYCMNHIKSFCESWRRVKTQLWNFVSFRVMMAIGLYNVIIIHSIDLKVGFLTRLVFSVKLGWECWTQLNFCKKRDQMEWGGMMFAFNYYHAVCQERCIGLSSGTSRGGCWITLGFAFVTRGPSMKRYQVKLTSWKVKW